MLIKIKYALLKLEDVKMTPSMTHKIRGYVGNLFKQYDVIHNHDSVTGKTIYRYPIIQFKMIGRTPAILALTEGAVEAFSEIFLNLTQIDVEGERVPVCQKNLTISEVVFGYLDEVISYRFISPWIGLNQKNYSIYQRSVNEERSIVLERALIGNILSLSKYLNLWLEPDQKIKVTHDLKKVSSILKGNRMIGFRGGFQTNFLIPDYVGLGKSVSRGFGIVEKVNDA